MKQCRRCGIEQPLSDFYANPASKDGHRNDCKACISADRKAKYDPVAAAISNRRYRESPNGKAAFERASRKKNLAKYGLDEDGFADLLESQGGVCAICGIAQPKWFCVDHDHATGAVRGILCTHCNIGLGYFRDSVKRLDAAMAYLNERAAS